MQPKIIIGQVGEVIFPELSEGTTAARIDTGAQTSAIWVSQVSETPDGLAVIFFDESSDLYSGEAVLIKEYSDTVVISSNGNSERRYKIRLLCVIAGRRIRGWFTLADRSKQKYPVLLGRNILKGKFIVDVAVPTTRTLRQDHSRPLLPTAESKVRNA
jgi:hypothetical protein